MLEIEILNDELGCPKVQLRGYFEALAQEKGISRVWLSLSHSRDYATAQCVMEKD